MPESVDGARRPPARRRWWRTVIPLAVGGLIVVLPRPAGLSLEAWWYFAVFLAVIVGLVTEAVPGAVAGLIGITVATVGRLVAPGPVESIRLGDHCN